MKTIQNNITAYENVNINFIEQGAKFLKICNDVKNLYYYGNNSEKQELMNYVLQNIALDGENLSWECKAPFDIFAKGLSCTKKTPQVGLEPTTYRLTAGCSAVELLRNITIS